jgi:hypothetical protein
MRRISAGSPSSASLTFVPAALRFMVRKGFALVVAIAAVSAICTYVALASISIPTNAAYTQNFDSLGTFTTATLPADFRVDKPATVRTVGTFATALSNTTFSGGTNLGSSASNGIYNFGSTATPTDRAVGFLSSGTATSSGNLYAQLVNNTGASLSGLQISYNVEKYRNGTNPAGFRIQLFYSTDGATWTSAGNGIPGTNFLTSFAGDPTAGGNTGFANAPGVTVAVTNQTLTPAVNIPAGGTFYLAWNYSVASGTTTTNAQALAIDDISIIGIPTVVVPTNPTGTIAASVNPVQAGTSTLLTVNVNPGTNPTSTGLGVTADLTLIGGAAAQAFFDDGTHGDAVAGDNTYSFLAAVPAATTATDKTIVATITDSQSRSGSASMTLSVTPNSTPPVGVGSATPSSLKEGDSTLLTVSVSPGANPPSIGIGVVGNLTLIGGSPSQQFYDDGSHGDVTANDGVFSFGTQIASGTSQGPKSLPVTISDGQARSSGATISLTVQPPPPPTTVKISQLYGGGGNSGSTFTNDFIEIFNQAQTPVNLTGWSVQYGSATVTSWSSTNLCPQGTCILLPGHYFLVQESQGTGGTTPLPTPDASGTIAMSGTQAKVALVASTVVLSGACPTGGSIVDVVGYGVTNCSETTPTPVLSNTTAAVRKGNGCIDTDINFNDFVTVGPIPRNSASPANSCGGDPTQISGQGIATPGSLEPASITLLTVKVTPATNPPSTNVQVSADLSSIGGAAAQSFLDDGTHGDQVAGDNIFSFQDTVGAFIPVGLKSIVPVITDGQGRTATAPITLTISSPTCGVERWSVKTGTDPDAGLVNLGSPISGVIENLGLIPAPPDPPGPPLNARVAPTETTVWVVNGTLTFYKKESDVDYHIVVQDNSLPAHTIVTEIPSPACVGPTSPFGPAVASARAKFDARFPGVNGFFQTANIPVQIKGVGFFDFIHGQTGVAPNGIELHPVTEINFTANTTSTLASSLNPSQYGQGVAITATVSNGGTTIPTGAVKFSDGATPIGNVPLDPNGQAKLTITNLLAGSHSITTSYEGDSTSAPSISTALLQVVNKADQTINFGALAGKTFGAADFTVSASASSELNVGLSIVSGPATITGNTVHITGAGTVTVRASQAGDDNHNAAPDVDQSFDVGKANQTITFAPLPDLNFGAAPFTVFATGGASGNAVNFIAVGTCTSGAGDGSTITITGGGLCTVTASQTGDSNYNGATPISRSFTVRQASATITVNGYSGVYDAQAHGASGTATGVSSENLGSLLNLGASFTNVPGGTAHWSFAGNANYSASSGDASVVITKATASFSNISAPVITFGTVSTTLSGKISLGSLVPTGNIAITLNGVTQNVAIQAGGNFSANFATGSLAAVNPPYTVTYSYGGDGNFNGASAAGTLTVNYGIVALFDQSKAAQGGSTVPIKLLLVNSSGADVSSASIVVTAVQLVQTSTSATSNVQDSGNANPDGNFRFDPTIGPSGGYIFNLSTKGLASGSWQLLFTVGGDSTQHAVSFQVR